MTLPNATIPGNEYGTTVTYTAEEVYPYHVHIVHTKDSTGEVLREFHGDFDAFELQYYFAKRVMQGVSAVRNAGKLSPQVPPTITGL